MKVRFSFLLCCLILNSLISYAQKLPVSVNYLTGTANVNIPVTALTSGAVSVPVSLSYNATGVRVKDAEGKAGLGWRLNAGGQIGRQVRGLPDDVNGQFSRYGWLYNDNGAKIDTFSITNTGTCTTEKADVSNINLNFSNVNDTEPDLFFVNAPGLSCQLVFDKGKILHTLSKEDLKVSYTTDVLGAIATFKIVNDKGVTYSFTDRDLATKQLQTTIEANVSYLKCDYNLYKQGINYSSTWYLTQITDANGNAVNFSYLADDNKINTAQELNLYLPGSGTTTAKTYQYTIAETFTQKHLAAISNNVTTISFNYNSSGFTNRSFLSSITWPGITCVFNYAAMVANNEYSRYVMTDVSLNDASTCKMLGHYSFDYIGGLHNPLPDSTSKKIDYWGYYNNSADITLLPQILINPSNTAYNRYQIATDSLTRSDYTYSLAGGMRKANPATVMTASLWHIYYDDNAKTTLEYESNDYYDPTAAGIVHGGGIRIKKITDFDGIDSTRNMVRTFNYANPHTGVSSGKPVTLPVFAFTIPYSGSGTTAEKWNWSTIRSENDLSDEDHSIFYSYVRESRPGGGSTLYQYDNPATYWDSSSGDWAQTTDYFGRASTCFTVGFAANGRYLYPFAPNPNYDFERGQLSKVTSYNGTTKVSSAGYTYVRTASGTPNTIYGLRFTADKDSTYKNYAKYKIYTDVNKLVSVKADTVYDVSTPTLYQPSSTSYYYASAYHKLLTSQVATNSDGRVITSYYKYVKDYMASASADSSVNALYHMQVRNMNMPVEQYVQTDRGGTVTTTGAAVSKYKLFALGADSALVLPSVMYSLSNPAGVGSFAPSAITGGSFVIDSRYTAKMYNTIYAPKGYLQTAYSNSRQGQTVITDQFFQKPLAIFSNAAADQIGYSNFNQFPLTSDFTKTGATSTYSTDTRVGPYSLSLQTGTTLNRSLKKGALAANSIFSAWIKSSSSGSFTVKVVHGTDSASRTYSYASPAGNWVYVQYKVPLTGVTGDYTIRITCDHAILIDDLLFYPDNAEVSTTEYSPGTFFKLAQTNTNGKAGYVIYDGLGRPLYGLDQDKNVVMRKTYIRNDELPPVLPKPAFTVSRRYGFTNDVYAFTALGLDCDRFTGTTYSWNFGDGTTSTLTTPTHTYTTAGTYKVLLTRGATGYTSVTSDTTEITVTAAPAYLAANAFVNPGTGDIISVTLFEGGVIKYSFTGAGLVGMVVTPGVYNISVQTTGDEYDPLSGNGYGSINTELNGIAYDCRTWRHQNSYLFSGVDLTSGSEFNISMVTGACP